MSLKHTETNINYIYDYIPVRAFANHSEEEIEISKQIWAYKDMDEDANEAMTKDLMKAIAEIAQKSHAAKIGLVAVPPSKVGKASAVCKSIEKIYQWYNEGLTKSAYGCEARIYDYSKLLTRASDISTAHEGRRATYSEQYASMACAASNLAKYRTTFIILDDVTTLGTSMDVCRDKMVEYGANPDFIFRLAIAKTEYNNNEAAGTTPAA